MNVTQACVTENRRLYGDTYETWFQAPGLVHAAVPGQFVMVAGGEGIDPLWRRAYSIYRLREGAEGIEFGLLYEVVGRGTAWLAQRRPGDRVFAYGPLGRGYRIHPNAQNLLLVAGGIGVAPLVWLADTAVAQRRNATLVVGGRDAAHVYPAHLLPPELEIVVTTEDGSLGRRGLVTEPLATYLPWADQVFACGPNAMFRAIAEVMHWSRSRKPVQVLLEERMPCGLGICYGCAVFTKRGVRLICKDGPRFDLRDLY